MPSSVRPLCIKGCEHVRIHEQRSRALGHARTCKLVLLFEVGAAQADTLLVQDDLAVRMSGHFGMPAYEWMGSFFFVGENLSRPSRNF